MKKYPLLIVTLLLLAGSISALAQPGPGVRKEMLEKLKAAKWAFIVYRLGLNEQKANQLLPVYEKYEQERMAVIRPGSRLLMKQEEELTGDEAEELMDTRLENAKKLLDIREKYQKEFLKVLTAEELLIFQKAERDFAFKVMAERHKRRNARR